MLNHPSTAWFTTLTIACVTAPYGTCMAVNALTGDKNTPSLHYVTTPMNRCVFAASYGEPPEHQMETI
jgi:hypothetical protein